MGQNRLSVKISVVGDDGISYEIDQWVNWTSNQPSKIFDAMVRMAEKASLPVDSYYEDQDT